MKCKRIILRTVYALGGLLALLAATAGILWWYYHPGHSVEHGIVYSRRDGVPLTMAVARPKRPNGLAIALMVSGSWKSSTNSFKSWMAAPLLRRGYTIFAVTHISQPQVTIGEITEDMHRAIRFIRHHAKNFRIDPSRIGITGGSAGGHLSLMMATRGSPGQTDAENPIDREDSSVQAVAIFFPVTDLLNLGSSRENPGDGGPPKSYVKGFGPGVTNLEVWKPIGHALSPIYHVKSNMAPVLIYHGDEDNLVPLDQSLRFQQKARELGNQVEVVVHEGGEHGWLSMLWDIRAFADWFDRHLAP